jgi:GT2 family glycosyltransferase
MIHAHSPIVGAGLGMRSVCVVLVNWNGTSDTLTCLESLRGLSYLNLHVIVIDNGSLEPCTSRVRERHPDVQVIESEKNLGFTGGNNLGIRIALERCSDYVWLLNNDTVVEPDTLTELVRAADADVALGIVGSKIYFFGTNRIDHAGCSWDSLRGDAYHIGCREMDEGQYDEQVNVFFVTGCSFLVKSQVFRQVGLLDEGYFMYMEDIDFCTRARRSGWEVAYVPASRLHHKGGSVGSPNPRQHYLYARNRLRYVSKHHSSLLPRTIVQWTRDCVVGPIRSSHWDLVMPSFRAFRDWALNRTGAPS